MLGTCTTHQQTLLILRVASTCCKEVGDRLSGLLLGVKPEDLLPWGLRVVGPLAILLACMGAGAGDVVEREARLAVDALAHRIKANANAPDAIVMEAIDPATLQMIASFRGLSQAAMEGIRVVRSPESQAVSIRQTRGSADVFEAVKEQLRWYMTERAGGHSRAFVAGCLTNQLWRPANPDKDMQYLLARHPRLPIALLQRSLSGVYTNRVGSEAGRGWLLINTNGEFREYEYTNRFKEDELVTWTDYVLVDGELAWIYQVRNPPQEPYLESVGLADAKEYDPKFRNAILRAEKEAVAKLQKEGTPWPRQWQIDRAKQELLEHQGIRWRSPSELAPRPRRDWDLLE
jgi:hypothetical protein